MEAIREYLNNLFMSLPETPEVLRAKAALLEMMEDKYEEMLQEGKTEEEAVGIVISEFGNLEELAEELGIDVYMKKEKQEKNGAEAEPDAVKPENAPPKKGYRWNFEDTRQYVSYAWRHAVLIAVGVMLCIWAPFMECIFDGAVQAGYMPEIVGSAVGTACFFLSIAMAVMLFVGASGQKKRYGNISRFSLVLDERAARFVSQKREKDEDRRLSMRIVGIALCIVSVVPSSINWFQNPFLREIMDTSVLFIVGVGVLLLVLSASVGNRYRELERAVKNGEEQENIVYENAMFENYHKRRISGGIICAFVLFGFFLIAGMMWCFLMGWKNYSETGSEQIQNESSYDVEGLTKIKVDLDIGDLQIKTTDTDKVQFQYSGQSNYVPEVTQKNGVLQLREKSRGFHFAFFFWNFPKGDRTVTLLVPESLSSEGERKGVSYQIDMDAGNVFIDGAGGEVLDVNVDAGNLEGENCVFYGKSKIEVDAGNADFQSSHFTNLKADVDCGNFSLETFLEPLSAYDLKLDTDLGDIIVNGQKMGNSYQAGPKNGEPASGQLDIEVDLGQIELSEPSREQ